MLGPVDIGTTFKPKGTGIHNVGTTLELTRIGTRSHWDQVGTYWCQDPFISERIDLGTVLRPNGVGTMF